MLRKIYSVIYWIAAVAIGLGAFYIVFGAAAYAYARDPFWLFFLAQGVMLLGATLGLPNQPKMSAA
jgi:hypothetical protein